MGSVGEESLSICRFTMEKQVGGVFACSLAIAAGADASEWVTLPPRLGNCASMREAFSVTLQRTGEERANVMVGFVVEVPTMLPPWRGEVAKEEFEHRLAIAELREEVALRETRYGSCSSGSEYVTVRLASLCGLCREKLGAEADCRVARGRLAELAAAKPLGAVPPSLSGPWPPEVTRVPREPRGRAPAMPPPPQSACKMGTSEPSATPQRPGGAASMWRELTATDGRALYYNVVTNTTTSVRPRRR
ncbi:uncharacterized protein Tco025E_07965 [Trypanosoma conorhini]|uniref:WW domain-containing protein n=1 Tax=Trypanosoma conorhini TaxID=83891 RepID=A0A422NGH7_9TRYP|nr:uncharacterized protein Tco025E_07965 [Trypanosoma conorhini]RNF04558.1 hypothetical protein Tco025E_07965 [Trypanosoma conorhini]